ncbi:hypothetical protein SAMN05421874_128144 [Nonomuraea maritima]|uniref:Uncharacterized protein n=2 Tax=Nonomuraea maritima TaxID=683260 RepID=A0A1G9MSH1_9ACTN|nr:hypothetical protein SAMN05421874_128144 [Nonomuraea maritima]
MKILVIVIVLLTATIAALITGILTRWNEASATTAIIAGGTAFAGTTYLGLEILSKLGILPS